MWFGHVPRQGQKLLRTDLFKPSPGLELFIKKGRGVSRAQGEKLKGVGEKKDASTWSCSKLGPLQKLGCLLAGFTLFRTTPHMCRRAVRDQAAEMSPCALATTAAEQPGGGARAPMDGEITVILTGLSGQGSPAPKCASKCPKPSTVKPLYGSDWPLNPNPKPETLNPKPETLNPKP